MVLAVDVNKGQRTCEEDGRDAVTDKRKDVPSTSLRTMSEALAKPSTCQSPSGSSHVG